MTENPLSKLALDYWYQVLLVVSIVIFVMAGAGLLKALPTESTLLISLGCFFVALGEWINHPLQTQIWPASIYHPRAIVRGHPRGNAPIGVALVALGAVIIFTGLYKLFA